MEIDIVTPHYKKTTKRLNISLISFGFFVLTFIISSMLLEVKLMKYISIISVFASCFFILSSIILSVYRQYIIKTIDLSNENIIELLINSQRKAGEISKSSEISYSGNQIKTNNNSKLYEINNTTAFKLLNDLSNVKATCLATKSNYLHQSPKSLFNDIMSTLWEINT